MVLKTLIRNLLSGSRRKPLDSVIDSIHKAFAANDIAAASSIVESALTDDPEREELMFFKGVIELKHENHADALAAFSKALAGDTSNVEYQYHVALCHKLLGNTSAAVRACNEVLARNPLYGEAHNLLSVIELPGPYYLEILANLHRTLKPKTYLEIGVESGRTIALAHTETSSIGVDPEPRISVALNSGVRIFPMTSDSFFANHDVSVEFGNRAVDMTFIDGMHHFDFALRDFATVEQYCRPDSIVLIHDCYPLDRKTASRNRQTQFWSGDVWKTVVALKKYRPDLEIHAIGAPPTGLGLIRNLNPDSRVLTERMKEIVEEMNEIDYSVLDNNKRETLNWFPNDWPSIEKLVKTPSHPA